VPNPVIDCLCDHRSVRRYKKDPIRDDHLEQILRAGTRAATGGNLQLYSFVVIDDDEKKAELDAAFGGPAISISHAPAVIIALVDLHRVKRWLNHHSDRTVCVNRPEKFFLAFWDALIALQDAVVAAESLGIGTCYIDSVLEMNMQEILGAPEHVFPAGMVCLGYPEVVPDLSMRLPLEAVVHRNGYHDPTPEEIGEWYSERDAVWDRVPQSRKEKLAEEGIHGIAQALAVQKFAPDLIEERSQKIIENLERAGFNLALQ